MSRQPIIFIELATPEVSTNRRIEPETSWLLCHATNYNDLHILVYGDSTVKKDASLGRLFSELEPTADGNFFLELGVTLPDLLPCIDAESEYVLDLQAEDNSPARLAFSNQMVRVNYVHAGSNYHAIFPFRGLPKAASFGLPLPENPPFQRLRTTATMRFTISGTDAEDALEENIEKCIGDFASALNKALSAFQVLDIARFSTLSTAYESRSFPLLYLVIHGKDQNLRKYSRVAPHSGKIALNPPILSQKDASHLADYLSGKKSVDPAKQMIAMARSSLESGLLQSALLQMVIAVTCPPETGVA